MELEKGPTVKTEQGEIVLGGVAYLTDPYDKTAVMSDDAYRRSYWNGECNLAQKLILLPEKERWALLVQKAKEPRKIRGRRIGVAEYNRVSGIRVP